MIKGETIIRVLLVGVFTYFLIAGATFNAMLTLLDIQQATLILFGLMAGGWLFVHRWRQWTWYRTPLDPVFVLWVAVMALASIANPETWRRSAEAAWYIGLYLGVWYLLSDTLMNRGIRRETFIDALLIAGAVPLVFGFIQIGITFSSAGTIPRVAGTLGNPNTYGGFLVMLLPFALVRAWGAKHRIGRWFMSAYSVVTGALLALTFSRGAWVGAVISLLVLIGLLLAHYDLLSVKKIRAWWAQQTSRIKNVLRLAMSVSVLVGVVGGVWVLMSFTDGERSLSLRTYLWEGAVQMFAEQPLTGQGLFTFGYHINRFSSVPPRQPQAHAHSIPFNVVAEFGVPGLVALVLSVVIGVGLLRRNWRQVRQSQRLTFIGATAALIGVGGHHLLDTPIMMPVLALMALLVLALALTPYEPQPMQAAWRVRGHPVGMIGLWLLLMVAGLWHNALYTRYQNILQTAVAPETRDYVQGAENLQAIIDIDPQQPVYPHQQALLYALAETPTQAIVAYERYLTLEPYDAKAWAHLSALHWHTGDIAAAQDAIARAVALAPRWGDFKIMQQIYAGTYEGDNFEPRDTVFWLNRPHFQFLRDVIPIQWIPQVATIDDI